jgi:hypothetical protein
VVQFSGSTIVITQNDSFDAVKQIESGAIRLAEREWKSCGLR